MSCPAGSSGVLPMDMYLRLFDVWLDAAAATAASKNHVDSTKSLLSVAEEEDEPSSTRSDQTSPIDRPSPKDQILSPNDGKPSPKDPAPPKDQISQV